MTEDGRERRDDRDPARPGRGRAEALFDPISLTRIVLRPVANPLGLGFFGLAAATLALAGQEIGWIPADESVDVAVVILASAPLLQLIACLVGFLTRDAVAATGMGLLSATWLIVGIVHLRAHPEGASRALGTFLVLAGVALLLSAVTAAGTSPVPAAVMTTAGVRFLLTAAAELSGSSALRTAAGAVGCLLAGLALYAVAAIELEARPHPSPPMLRPRPGVRPAPSGDLAGQIGTVEAEPGVRSHL